MREHLEVFEMMIETYLEYDLNCVDFVSNCYCFALYMFMFVFSKQFFLICLWIFSNALHIPCISFCSRVLQKHHLNASDTRSLV